MVPWQRLVIRVVATVIGGAAAIAALGLALACAAFLGDPQAGSGRWASLAWIVAAGAVCVGVTGALVVFAATRGPRRE